MVEKSPGLKKVGSKRRLLSDRRESKSVRAMHRKNSKPEPLVVSLSTLAEQLDANRSSVRRWLKEADIQPIAVGQGSKGAIRYRWPDVREWLESRQYVE